MEKSFEAIGKIETLIAAALVDSEGKLMGWCANSAISPQRLVMVAQASSGVFTTVSHWSYLTDCAVAAFGEKTLIARHYPCGVFIAFLDSPVNDDVLAWFWRKLHPLLEEAGLELD